MPEFPELIGQGPATLVEAGSPEEDKDTLGYTNPNLHRRIMDKDDRIAVHEGMEVVPDVLGTNDYTITLEGLDSYRTVTTYEHTEIEGSPFENEIP